MCIAIWGLSDRSRDDEARMWEIAENLHRADLTVLERDEHIAEWVRLSDVQSSQAATIESKREDGRELEVGLRHHSMLETEPAPGREPKGRR